MPLEEFIPTIYEAAKGGANCIQHNAHLGKRGGSAINRPRALRTSTGNYPSLYTLRLLLSPVIALFLGASSAEALEIGGECLVAVVYGANRTVEITIDMHDQSYNGDGSQVSTTQPSTGPIFTFSNVPEGTWTVQCQGCCGNMNFNSAKTKPEK